MWNKTSEKLPSQTLGEQVHVLMWSPSWDTWLKGVYIHGNEDEWRLYDQQYDRFIQGVEAPEFWCNPDPEFLVTIPELTLAVDERRNQIVNKKWTTDHDREFNQNGELVLGAIAYAKIARRENNTHGQEPDMFRPKDWPWDGRYWKPSGDPVRNLIKAAAMLLAEAKRITKDSH